MVATRRSVEQSAEQGATTQSPPPRNTILQGDALTRLRELPDACVQTCVSSPPYWGLRSYSTAPQIWDADPECAHEWGPALRSPWANEVQGPHGFSSLTREGAWRRQKETGPFCQRCSAWRGELGSEPSVDLYVRHLVAIFCEVWRVLRPDGLLWCNLGDSYAGSWGNYAPGGIKGTQRERHDGGERWERKAYGDTTWLPPSANGSGLPEKSLIGVPWRVAFALQEFGWVLRSDIVWAKVACMPESVRDRPTRSHEYLFLFAKQSRYYYDATAIQEPVAESSIARVNQPTFAMQHGGPNDYGTNGVNANRSARHALEGFAGRARSAYQSGHGRRHAGFNDRWDALSAEEQQAIGRNKRDVWFLSPEQFPAAHFAVMPQALVSPCILAGSSHKACETCGAPWRRVERREREKDPTVGHSALRGAGHMRASAGGPANREGREFLRVVASETTGWVPTCACEGNTGTSRSLVLDPFMGAGTVALVAKLTGRDYLGIELNGEYVKLAERRIALFGRLGRGQPPPKAGEQAPPSLWAGVDLDGEGGEGEGDGPDAGSDEARASGEVW